MSTRFHILLVSGALLVASCKNNAPSTTNGPIVLGDSSAIITEEDPQKLKDLVTDLEPKLPAAEPEPEEKKPAQDTTVAKKEEAKPVAAATTTEPAKPQPAANVSGLNARFKDVTVQIPNLDAKLAGRPNLERANGAVYTLNEGSINGNKLVVSGATITKVSMRYQSAILLTNSLGTFVIDPLSNTTDWEQMKGNGAYPITGLDSRNLEYSDARPAAIREAVKRTAQRRRMSRKKINEMVESVEDVHKANQKPLAAVLRSVMWKIDGKDAKGHQFSKQIRIDIPL
jgi:hypothetical protein